MDRQDQAFAQFFNQYLPVLQRHAYGWMKRQNWVDAQDIAQETMIRASRYMETLRKNDNPIGWLIAIQINVLKTHYLKEKKQPDFFSLEDESPVLTTHSIELPDWLLPHIQNLPSAKGELLDALIEQNRDTYAVAQRLGVSEGTVRATLAKIRANIINSLGWGDWFRYCRETLTNEDMDWVNEPLIALATKGQEHAFWFGVCDATNDAMRDAKQHADEGNGTMALAMIDEIAAIAYRNKVLTFPGGPDLFNITSAYWSCLCSEHLYKTNECDDDAERVAALSFSIGDILRNECQKAAPEKQENVMRRLGLNGIPFRSKGQSVEDHIRRIKTNR